MATTTATRFTTSVWPEGGGFCWKAFDTEQSSRTDLFRVVGEGKERKRPQAEKAAKACAAAAERRETVIET